MGTSLALVGAYILAGELGPAADAPLEASRLDKALSRYETRLRRYVVSSRDLPAGIDGYAPMSNSNIVIGALMMKWMQRWPFGPIATKKYFTKADAIELPDYVTAGPAPSES